MMRRTLSRSLVALGSISLAAIAGCSAPIPEGRFACTDDSQCPPGLMCGADDLCRTGGATIDSGLDAARIDSGGPELDMGPGAPDTGLDAGPVASDGGSDSGCANDPACDDGHYCNGPEHCAAGACVAGALPCTSSQTCSEANHTCTMATCTTDADGDTYVAASCGGPDCNDADPSVNPSRREVCDGIDNDCDGMIDDNAAITCTGHASTTAACTSGACAYTCVGSALTCDSTNPGDATGCEVDPTNDINNCGGCARVCTPGAGQTASCNGSHCVFACGSGRLDCDGVASNGCETPGTTCDIDPPRSIGPMDEMAVTSNRPTFRFAPAAGTTDAHVEICMDEACATIVQTVDGPSPLTATTMLSPGHYFWRAHARVGTYNATRASFAWGFSTFSRATTSIPSANAFPYLDVDHGAPDLIIGSPQMGSGGSARLYLGATSAGTTPFIGGAQGFGSAVAIAGDVNGDGFGDVVIGACIGSWLNATTPTPTMGCASQAFYYQSVGNGTFASPVMINPGAAAGFGNAVSSAGDFNGDGYGDVVIGAYWVGRASIYFGSPAGLDLTSFLPLAGGSTSFGASVALAGDVNADGYDDVLIGHPQAGHAFLYLGQAAGAPVLIQLGSGVMGYGASVSGVGDFNGDGYADFAVSTDDEPGLIEIRLGGPSISVASPPAVFTTFTIPGTSDSVGGASVAGFGDCNGDGLTDVASGSYGGTIGTVSAFHGGPTSAASGPIGSITNTATYFGRSVGRLAGPSFATAACSSTGACSQRVDQLMCSGGSLTMVQTWMDPTQPYFGAGLMR